MHDAPRQKLRELIVEYGRSLCDDPRRCEALLKDYCGQYKQEIFVLISALKNGVADDLLKTSTSVPQAILFARLHKRLEEKLAMTAEAAHWAVESWALALEGATQRLPIVQPTEESVSDESKSTSGQRLIANGRGVKQDDAQVVEWYCKAAEQGDALAQRNLGSMYRVGCGVKQDDAQAVEWYRKATERPLKITDLSACETLSNLTFAFATDTEILQKFIGHPDMALADGHGSAKNFRSRRGSRLAVVVAQKVCGDLSQPGSLSQKKHWAEEQLPLALVRRWQAQVKRSIQR